MVITKITETKRKRFSIYIDNKFTFACSGEMLSDSGIYVGKEIDEMELEGLRRDSGADKVEFRALNLLSYREHSSKELVEKLSKKNDKDMAELAVEKLTDMGMVDDERFGYMYAEELYVYRLMGPIRIRHELAKKGIDREMVSQIIDEICQNDLENATKLVEQKYYGKLNDKKNIEKIVAGLYRMGYSFDIAKQAIRDASDALMQLECEE